MATSAFRFRKFVVEQSDAVHPVGTDAVLLGAWAPVPAEGRILDIGCGTGVISLILAQRSSDGQQIDAIDSDEASVVLARRNFASSSWSGRLEAHCADASGFDPGYKYGLIVSNPPFFTETTWSEDASRKRSRHISALRPEVLLRIAQKLLLPSGKLCVITPPSLARHLMEQGASTGLYTTQWLTIITRAGKKTERTIQVMERTPYGFRKAKIVLFDAAMKPTPAFFGLVGDVYE